MNRFSQLEKKMKRKSIWKKTFYCLAAVVVFVTTYMLILPAITSNTTPICGYEEHTHTDDCYSVKQVLVCELEEVEGHIHDENCYDNELVCTLEESEEHIHNESCYEDKLICELDEIEGHTHTEACYQEKTVLTCTLEEHTHTDECYPTADEETKEEWESTFADVELTGNWNEDVIAIAKTQLGYKESEKNYITNDDGTISGYTRYGAWYGEPYTDQWNSLFTSFCLNYAEIPNSEIPSSDNCQAWIDGSTNRYYSKSQYTPSSGDIVLLDTNSDNKAESSGIIVEISDSGTAIKTIEGDIDDSVQYVNYTVDDEKVLGYISLQSNDESEDDTDDSEDTIVDENSVFTFTDTENKFTATLNLTNNEYSSDDYDLKVTMADVKDTYESALNNIVKNGKVLQEAYSYKLSLVRKSDSTEVAISNSEYTVSMTWTNGLFKEKNAKNYFNFTNAQNSGNQLTELSSPTVTYNEDNSNIVGIETTGWYSSAEFVFVRSDASNGLTAGNYSLTFNNTEDAFLNTKYYNVNSPIGTAGSFHIVAFNTATLNSHTNGNILAKNLYANSNFGTNNYLDELSYIQNYLQVNSTSASRSNHVLALGSSNVIDFVDNNNRFSVNGTNIDKPNHLIQDYDTAANPFINLERVKIEISQISLSFSEREDANLDYVAPGQYSELKLVNSSGVGVKNYKASELSEYLGSYLHIDGFKSDSNGTVIINVDCAGVTEINMPQARVYVDGKEIAVSETIDFSAGKVIWNFINADGVTINTHLMTGIIIAPGSTVNIEHNLNGTVVAENINVNAESHRTDFSGDVEEKNGQVTIKKVETGYVGIALEGAEFDLYKWNDNDWEKVGTYITSSSGKFELDQLDLKVAYKLVETKAPTGYVINSTPTYFWIRGDTTTKSPTTYPDDFAGTVITVSGTLLISNSKSQDETDLIINKEWKSIDGTNLIDVAEDYITVNVYQLIDNNETQKRLYTSLNISKDNDWTATLSDLPKNGYEDDKEVSYTYTIEEISVDGYTTSIIKNGNVYTIVNTKEEEFILPETGGIGTHIYTICGISLMLIACVIHHILKRKDGMI